MRRIRAIVSGRVQGVSYRASTAARARSLALVGWVRNLPDGSVELEAEGPHESVEALLAWCHEGPPAAQVTTVTIDEIAPSGSDHGFVVRA
jgi:acylphosphatase